MKQLPIILVPGLAASPRLYAAQMPELWRFGPVTVAAHASDDSIAAIARRILSWAPPRFALIGLSMGGYIAFEIARQAGERIERLALLDTSARPDSPEQAEGRRAQIAMAESGRLTEAVDLIFPRLVHPSRYDDEALRRLVHQMAADVGAQGFVRQQKAIMDRPDSRPSLAAIRCPTLVLVGAQDQATPPERAAEIAAGIAGARQVVVPECGHLSTLERPEAVTRALIELLQA
jgi:pimeloyl-ACP methyl ester carboxylesterase